MSPHAPTPASLRDPGSPTTSARPNRAPLPQLAIPFSGTARKLNKLTAIIMAFLLLSHGNSLADGIFYETYVIINGGPESGDYYYELLDNGGGNTRFDSINQTINLLTSPSLTLKGGEAKLYATGGDYQNSNNTQLTYYRIYDSNDSAPSYSTEGLNFISETYPNYLWQKSNASVDLLSGLDSGLHRMDVYNDGNFSYFSGSQQYFEIAATSTYTANFTLFYGATGTGDQSSAFTGTGYFNMNGSATTYVLDEVNTYTGETQIDAGTVELRNSGNLSSSSAIYIGSGTNALNSQLTLNGTVSEFSNSIQANSSSGSGNRTLAKTGSTAQTLSGSITVNRNLILDVSGTGGLTLSGAISSNTTSDRLFKTGTGTLTISGSNAFNSQTQIGAGTLIASNNNALGTGNTGTATRGVDIGVFSDAGTSTDATLLATNGVTIGQSIYVAPNTSGAVRTLGLSGSGSAEFTNEIFLGGNLTLDGGSGTVTLSGNLINTEGVVVDGGTVVLSGDNTYDGSTTISSGTLSIASIANGGATSVLGDSSNAAANLVFDGGTLTYTGSTASTDRSFTITSGSSAVINVSNGATNLTLSGAAAASNGGLTKAGSGTLTLSGANAYTGTTTVSAGTLATSAANKISDSSAVSISSGATLSLGGLETVGSIAGAGNITLGSNTLTAGGDNTSTSLSGVISGTGSLAKTGSGTLTLSGSNTFTGTTTVSAGTLATSGANRISDSSAVSISSGATFSLGGSETVASIAGAGNIALGSNTLTAGGDNTSTSLSGVISGTGSFAKTGSGTLTLSGSNTFTGTTTVSAGTLAVGSGSTTGSLAGNVANSGVLAFNRSNASTYSGSISGSGEILKQGTGNLTISGSSSFTGGTQLQEGGLLLGHNNALGTGNLTITYGLGLTKTLASSSSAARSIANDVNIYNNDLLLGQTSGGTGALTFTGNVSLGSDGSTVTRNLTTNTATTFSSGVISGGANNNLAKFGSATLTLAGANTYSGDTLIESGTLQLGSGGTTGSLATTGSITNNATLVFNRSNAVTQGTDFSSSAITGTGSIVQNGTGNLTLNAANTHSGGTLLNSGTITLANTSGAGTGTITQADGSSLLTIGTTGTVSNAMSLYNLSATESATLSGSITVNNATFDVADGDTLTISGGVSGSGGVTKNGTGTLVLEGTNTYTGNTTVNAGTLQANSAGALGNSTSSDIIVNGGSLLVTADDALNGHDITLAKTATGNASVAALAFNAAYEGTIGALTLSANSVIDLGTTNNIALTFASIANLATYTLQIFNWTGTTFYGGTDRDNADQIYVSSSLSSNELANISFYSDGNTSSFLGDGVQLSGSGFNNGQVIPVPEPRTYAAAAALLAFLLFHLARLRRRPHAPMDAD